MKNRMAAPRSSVLEKLKSEPIDVLVIGGGIVGAGVIRDAALRGFRAGLIEKHDFASGTSSRSSRLLHGGLRYLAQGRIGLVREAGTEKTVVHRIAPHISEPLPFLFPTYKARPWDQWPRWKLSMGVRIYDLLSGIRDLRGSRTLGKKEMADLLPGIRMEKLTGGVRYFDGLTNDARLVIDTLRSAEKAGADVLNYCRLLSAKDASGIWECSVCDDETGSQHTLRTRSVVNATGPWAEKLEQSSVHLRLTKGVHLVIDRSRLPVSDAVVMTEGVRILFAIPWGERVILGTTDTDYQGRPEDVKTEPDDVSYILGVVNAAFPEAGLSGHDVIGTWAGIRPLVAAKGGGPSEISRSHEISMPHPGWFDVAGGKLTTYRLMAEQTVDRIRKFLGAPVSACVTASEPLLSDDETHGRSALVPLEPSFELVEHFCRNEWAVHLDDVMIRRGGWSAYSENIREIALLVANWMASLLGWDDRRRDEELARLL